MTNIVLIIVTTLISVVLVAVISWIIYRPATNRHCVGDFEWLQDKKFKSQT